MPYMPKFRETVPRTDLPPKEKLDDDRGWEDTRYRWNDEGHCSREACTSPHDNRIHQHSGLAYCARCQDLVNRMNPEVPSLIQTMLPDGTMEDM